MPLTWLKNKTYMCHLHVNTSFWIFFGYIWNVQYQWRSTLTPSNVWHRFSIKLSVLLFQYLKKTLLYSVQYVPYSLLSISYPPSLSPHSSQTLSYNPSIFMLEWRSNAFHLCASVVGLQGQGLPLFIQSPLSTLTPFQQNSESGSTQPLSLRSLSTLGPLLAWGSRGRSARPLDLCTLDPGDSGSLWNESISQLIIYI